MTTYSEPLGAYPGHVPDLPRQPRPAHTRNQYLTQEVNNLGCPVVQHKPLNKGVHTQMTLAKTFDDPAMRPKVFSAPVTVELNRPPPSTLRTDDVQGAQPARMIPNQWHDPRQAPDEIPSQQPASTAEGPAPLGRDHISICDIEGSGPMPRCASLSTRTPVTLKCRDLDGSQPGWRASRRTQAGRDVDPRFNVDDINNYMPPKSKTLFQTGPEPAAVHPPQPVAYHTLNTGGYENPAQAQDSPEARNFSGPNLEYTGLPEFQTQLAEIARQRRELEIKSAPITKVQEEISALASAQQLDLKLINTEITVAQELQKRCRDTRNAHLTRVTVADEQRADREAAITAFNGLELDSSTGFQMLKLMKGMDRTTSGKLTVSEAVQAMRGAGLDVETARIRCLLKGLRDNVGLFEYKQLGDMMVARGLNKPQPTPAAAPLKARSASARPAHQNPAAEDGVASAAVSSPHRAVSFRPATAAPSGARGGVEAGPAPVHTVYHTYSPERPSTPQQQQYQQQQPSMGAADAEYPDPYGRRPQTAAPSVIPRMASPKPEPALPAACDSPKETHNPKFFPFKADAYWFGGRGPQEELSAEATSWKARGDLSHHVTQHYVSAGEMALLADPGLAPCRTAVTQIDPNLPGACHAQTLSSAVHTGALEPAQLAASLKSNQPRPPSAAAALAAMVQRISAGKPAPGHRRGLGDSAVRHSTGSMFAPSGAEVAALRASSGAPLRPTNQRLPSAAGSDGSGSRPSSAMVQLRPATAIPAAGMSKGAGMSARSTNRMSSSSAMRQRAAERSARQSDVSMVKALM